MTAEEIDYESLDEKPVRLVFLLVGRDNMVGPHIKLLSRISRLMNKEDFRRRLMELDTPQAILELFRQRRGRILRELTTVAKAKTGTGVEYRLSVGPTVDETAHG